MAYGKVWISIIRTDERPYKKICFNGSEDMEEQVKKILKWVQISDVHIMANDDSINNRLREKVIGKISRINGIDCVVITGDFFDKGKANATWLKSFLHQIRMEVSENIIFCPGNHDVNRNATLYDTDNSKILIRDEIVQNHRGSKRTESSLKKDDLRIYELLTEKSFSYFYQIMDKILCRPDSIRNYEYEFFSLPNRKEDKNILFLALNTELFSGQRRPQKEIRNIMELEGEKIQKALLSGDTDLLSTSVNKYIKVSRDLQYAIPIDDNLGFISEESVAEIKNIISRYKDNSMVIVLGHRPITLMPKNVQLLFSMLMEDIGSKIYLCGHVHKVKFGVQEVIETAEENCLNPYQFYQISVGGTFSDKSHYNMCSFAVCELVRSWDNNSIKLRSEVNLWNKRFSSEDIEGYDRNSEENFPYKWETVKMNDITIIHLNSPNKEENTLKKRIDTNESEISKKTSAQKQYSIMKKEESDAENTNGLYNSHRNIW